MNGVEFSVLLGFRSYHPLLFPRKRDVNRRKDEWAMVLLPLPDDEFSRVRLLAHESFHRVQAGLNLNASDAANGHLDTEAGRTQAAAS